MKSLRLSLSLGSLGLGLAAAALFISMAAAATQIDILGPEGSEEFGSVVHVLPNGNLLIGDPGYNAGDVPDVGAVYLYDGDSGALISRLTGSAAGDGAGMSIHLLTNGNFLVANPYWDNGVQVDAGAVTWGDGRQGVTGTISAANSLVGGTAGDLIGEKHWVTILPNGSFTVQSIFWDNGILPDVGALIWGDGAKGITGTVSTANALVGSSIGDLYSSFTVPLVNGNFVVVHTTWDKGAVVDAGAYTWGDGMVGVTGTIGSANSLVSYTENDGYYMQVLPLSNGNFLLISPYWDNGAAIDAGAITWGDGRKGITGTISAKNSLVNTAGNDGIHMSVNEISNGNYIVNNPYWNRGSIEDVGAVTWGNGTTGVTGTVGVHNSLVGSKKFDNVGITVKMMENGNYVVSSRHWDNDLAVDTGAVTWGDGDRGVTGTVGAENSLVGGTTNDRVGWDITELPNGNYLISSPFWHNGAKADAGAVTWADGEKGITGTISAANSLVGAQAGDAIGNGFIFVLANGNYVVRSPDWDNGEVIDAGAVTWGDGTKGITGMVSITNSLVGSTSLDMFVDASPGVMGLVNGNYVVYCPYWDNGTAENAGAATWGDGTKGVTGTIGAANSLVGSTSEDRVGENFLEGITLLKNGNYLVHSPFWDNGVVTDTGAVTWGDGTKGVTGTISIANSLIGSASGDLIGIDDAYPLANGNYVVPCGGCDHGGVRDAGAVTWGDGSKGVTGTVSTANSLMGSIDGDRVGSIYPGYGYWELSNGNYVVSSKYWNHGAAVDAGAVTWGDGSKGVTGTVSAANSLVGSTTGDGVDLYVFPLPDGNYVARIPYWDSGALLDAGAVTWGDGYGGATTGPVTADNSVLGTISGDGSNPNIVYDPYNRQVIVGHPLENIISLFRPDPRIAWPYHMHLPYVTNSGSETD